MIQLFQYSHIVFRIVIGFIQTLCTYILYYDDIIHNSKTNSINPITD